MICHFCLVLGAEFIYGIKVVMLGISETLYDIQHPYEGSEMTNSQQRSYIGKMQVVQQCWANEISYYYFVSVSIA